MDLDLTDDQTFLRNSMRSFFERESGPDVVRAAEPLGFNAELWRRAAGVGIPGMCVSPSAGGGGSDLLDAALVIEEYGRVVAPIPVVEHVVAGRALSRPGLDSDGWLARLAGGEVIATTALDPARDGVWHLVPAGAVADVVIGWHDGRMVAIATPPPMSGPRNHACSPVADRAVGAEPSGWDLSLPDAPGDQARIIDEWKTLTASALVGIAAKALDLGVDYARGRHQFGRPIGSFQALQHGLADLVGWIDGARLLVARAAWACDNDEDEVRRRFASMAFLFAADAAKLATARSLHVHGGYGVMREYDIQLLYRRARGWSLIAGDPERECLELADRLFAPVGR
jgi:alkylation response protein AidB-like acyl-CoA dehydrogenase